MDFGQFDTEEAENVLSVVRMGTAWSDQVAAAS